MSSGSGVGRSSDSPPKQKATSEIDDLNQGVGGMNLNSEQNDGWEVYGKKSKKKAGSSSGMQRVPQNPGAKSGGNWNTKAGVHPNAVQNVGTRNNVGSGRGSGNNWPTPNDPRKSASRANPRPQSYNRGYDNSYTQSPAAVPPPLKNGWDWSSRAASAAHPTEESLGKNEGRVSSPVPDDFKANNHDDEDNELDLLDQSDDELLSDDFDSDASDVSFETQKKNRWFKEHFETLDRLTVAEINDPERQWHCPACQGGPGAIEWFTLQPLMTHAKTKGVRVKLHRKLSELMEEELRQRGTSVVPPGEAYGIWNGIEEKDKEIVWPPMVIIMNTSHDIDENEKWIGMGNQELLDYFSAYAAVRARHSYGPQGHRGISVLIFEASAVGYIEAERLSQHFVDNSRDREAWELHPVRFYPGGKRQLYGYMAEKRDMDNFNQHSPGKSKLKFEMRSYIEMVVNHLKQMSEDNQQLLWFKNKAAKEQRKSKALEESFTHMSEKHRKTLEETKIARLRTKMHHEQNKEEMDYLEEFYKNQIKEIYEARNATEEEFEKTQLEQRNMVKQSNANPSSTEDHRHRAEEVTKFIKFQEEEMAEFVEEKEKLLKAHEDRTAAMKRKHWEETVALEKELDTELSRLMEKYSPQRSDQVNGSDAV